MKDASRPLVFPACVAALTAALACAACGGSDHPSTVADTNDTTASPVTLEPSSGADGGRVASRAGAGEPGMPARVCAPRTARECHFYYTDESGRRQCPMSFQLCSADGSEWLACGEWILGPSGDPEHVEPRVAD